MAAAHVARAVVAGTLHGSVTNNVLHFGTDIAEPDWNALAQAIILCIATAFKNMSSSEWKFDHIGVTPLFPALQDEITVFSAQPIEGTPFAGALPSFNAALISIQTGLGGKTHRGRMFLPGVIQQDVSQSLYTDSGLQKVIAFAACLASHFISSEGVDSTPYKIGVLSRKGITQATVGDHFTPATKLVARRAIATLHSRKIGVGV
jgi:hypothetical protein